MHCILAALDGLEALLHPWKFTHPPTHTHTLVIQFKPHKWKFVRVGGVWPLANWFINLWQVYISRRYVAIKGCVPVCQFAQVARGFLFMYVYIHPRFRIFCHPRSYLIYTFTNCSPLAALALVLGSVSVSGCLWARFSGHKPKYGHNSFWNTGIEFLTFYGHRSTNTRQRWPVPQR